MIRVAKCEEVLQWGFDETSLDGTPTLNQWVLVQEGLMGPTDLQMDKANKIVRKITERIERRSYSTAGHY